MLDHKKIKDTSSIRIGTAGWGIPSSAKNCFPEGDSLLERYSKVFNATEINSSFYRSHKISTYERWAAITPPNFLFAVKMPKEITHTRRLVNIEDLLDQFMTEISGLSAKLGPILVQTPPSFKLDIKAATHFFNLLRSKFKGRIVLEPRHLSWFELTALKMCKAHEIEFVFADPSVVSITTKDLPHPNYYRLHGYPLIYSSSYDMNFINQLASQLTHSSWIIFDNTKLGAAIKNALELKTLFKLHY